MGSTRQKDPKGSFIQKGTTEQQIFFDQWMEQGEEQMGGLFQQQKWRLNQSYWGDLLQTLDSKVIEVVEVRFLSPQSFSRPLESQASVPNLALPSTVMYCSTAVFSLLCNPYGVWLVVWDKSWPKTVTAGDFRLADVWEVWTQCLVQLNRPVLTTCLDLHGHALAMDALFRWL